MTPSTMLRVFVSMFAAAPDGGVREFQFEPATGRLTAVATTPGLPRSFFHRHRIRPHHALRAQRQGAR